MCVCCVCLCDSSLHSLQMVGTLVQVSMPQNGITAGGIAALAQAFGKNPNLQIIDLNDNTFTQEGACAMAKVGVAMATTDMLFFYFLSLRSYPICSNFELSILVTALFDLVELWLLPKLFKTDTSFLRCVEGVVELILMHRYS